MEDERRARVGRLGLLAMAALVVTLGLGQSGPPPVAVWAAPRPDTGLGGGAGGPDQPPGRPGAVGYLHTSGAKLLDAADREVVLAGVSWFGLETSTFAPHGLWARNWRSLLDQIAAAGANAIRLPFSNQLFDPESRPNGIDYQRNPELAGLTGLEVMDRVITEAGARGLRVILDRHRPGADAQSELWYTERYPEARWLADWEMLARRYRGNPAVIGADLHNEPHGRATWGSGDPATDWRLAAERAGNAILAVNPDWLIVVEGIERQGGDGYWWGGNLIGAGEFPVRLSVPGRLVYSAHDYGPGVYNQAWFLDPSFPANLPAIWDKHWGYLAQSGRAPVLMGEFGGRSVGDDTEGVWQRQIVAYLRANRLSYTYWAVNPNSGDTGGLLNDDWTTLNEAKLSLLGFRSAPAVAAVDGGAPAAERAPDAGARSLDSQGGRAAEGAGEPAAAMDKPAGGDEGKTAAAGLKVMLRSGRLATRSNNPAPELQIVNNGVQAVPLAGLELRYWLHAPTSLRQIIDLDWTSVGSEKLRLSLVPTAKAGQDHYVALSFPDAGDAALAAGDSVEVKLRIHKEDWSDYDQSEHYSFAPLDKYEDWDKVTLYRDGRLVWGREPGS